MTKYFDSSNEQNLSFINFKIFDKGLDNKFYSTRCIHDIDQRLFPISTLILRLFNYDLYIYLFTYFMMESIIHHINHYHHPKDSYKTQIKHWHSIQMIRTIPRCLIKLLHSK